MRLLVSLLLVLLAGPSLASAQTTDLGGDLTGYRKFVVYPHLQKGWESMQRGERDRAITELEHAHSLAPESVSVALHLASAYRKFGEVARAESLLRQQLARTPDDARLRAALTELHSPSPAPAARANPCANPATPCKASAASGEGRPATIASEASRPKTGPAAASSVVEASRVSSPGRVVPKAKPAVARPESSSKLETDRSAEVRAEFALAVQARRFGDALRQADSLIASDARRAALLDELSYKLVDAGATEQATRLLLEAYPFKTGGPVERSTLLERLVLLVEKQSTLTDPELSRLRAPLDTPSLRSLQATMWASLKQCDAVRAILGDMSTEYGYDDWMRLGDCTTATAPAVARESYARAHASQPGGRGSRELGYQAYAAGDYRTALDAWRSVGSADLARDGALSAATTALAAGENRLAADWLQSYREHGNVLNHRYWSLLGQSYGSTDAPAAIAAFERAGELQPDVDDFLRLAVLEREPDRQVQWLERAAEIDRGNASIQLRLAYAYSRAARPASALYALERAAALDPDNMNVQIALGYAHWQAGHPAPAQRALERALRADPNNLVLTKQLVYVAQRLKQNDAARGYAEQLLDIPTAFDDSPSNGKSGTAEDRRFAMQRLHEDLGRRVTLSLDGFSGSHVGTPANAPQAGYRYSSYAQFEADVRLGSPSIRDGSTVSASLRLLADGGVERSALPSENKILGVGLRWKPWRRQVIYLAAENQIGLEDRHRRDVLLRASASFLNGGRLGDDWHASGSGWFATNLYLDAAHYLKVDYSAFTADYRTSYHRKVASKHTLEPYGHVQFNSAWDSGTNRDVRGGLGVRWNIWYGGSTYDADPHKFSVGIEFQQAFETYLPERNGLFFTLGTRW